MFRHFSDLIAAARNLASKGLLGLGELIRPPQQERQLSPTDSLQPTPAMNTIRTDARAQIDAGKFWQPERERLPETPDLKGLFAETSPVCYPKKSLVEFDLSIKRTLDLEELVRDTLTSMLDALGPRDYALFLPNPSGDFALAAFVRFHLGTASEMLLDHVANQVEGILQTDAIQNHPTNTRIFNQAEEFTRLSTQNLDFICDGPVVFQRVVAHGEVVAAVLAFGKGAYSPTPQGIARFAEFGEAFGKQLVRVSQVQHRLHGPGRGSLVFDPSDGD